MTSIENKSHRVSHFPIQLHKNHFVPNDSWTLNEGPSRTTRNTLGLKTSPNYAF